MMVSRSKNARGVLALLLAAVLCSATLATAAQKTFELDAQQTKINFTLGDVLHTVHGTFRLKRGSIQFDDATGEASGQLVVDATSGESGNKSRDSKMHKEILESQKYPEIIFTPQHFKGQLAAQGKSHLEVEGLFTIHGQTHPVTLKIDTDLKSENAAADLSFNVPYVKWGMKNPSTFLLRVSEQVEIEIHAVATTASAAKTSPGPGR